MADVVIVGSIVMDLTAYVDRFPTPGETIQGRSFKTCFGGKGANQATMAKLLGSDVCLIGKVGQDSFGNDYMGNLKRLNISTTNVTTTSAATTGIAQIQVAASGENSIIVVPGANLLLTPDDVDNAKDCFTGAKVVVCQLEVPTDAVYLALEEGRKSGAITVLNPAPIPLDFYCDAAFFYRADIVCPNEQEAATLFGKPCRSVDEARRFVQLMADRGCKWPMMTLGSEGVVMMNEEREIVHIPAPTVTAIDTTGAGDSFVGSLAYYLARYPQMSLEEKVRRSVQIASISVQRPGTSSSYPQRKELPDSLFTN